MLGYAGHAGGNGSSLLNVFQFDSNCQTGDLCDGGMSSGYYTGLAFPKYAIHINDVANMKSVQNVDIAGDSCPGDLSCNLKAGVRLDTATVQNSNTKVQVLAVHCERHLSGTGTAYSDCVDDNGVPATIDGVHTDSHITRAVHIENNTGLTTSGVSLRNIVPAANHPAIVDDVNPGNTFANGQAIGEYDIEQSGNFLNPSGRSSLAGGLTPGAPLSPLSGGTGGTALVCDDINQINSDQRTSAGTFSTTCSMPGAANWFTSNAVVEFYTAGTYNSSTGAPSVTASIQVNGISVVTGTVGPSASQSSQGWIYSGQLSLTSLNLGTGGCHISGIGRLDFFATGSSESTAFANAGIGGTSTSTTCFGSGVALSLSIGTFTNMTNMRLNQLIVRVHQ